MTARRATGTTTILFTDLVRSTELMQRTGDERAGQIFRAHRDLLQEAVATNGGQEVKWLGDGLMVAFASAADAVRCAIAIQRAAQVPTGGQRLPVRVGLNAGEALLDGSDYFGTPVVVARRLCDRATGGEILCSGLVAGLLSGRHSFRFRSRGSLKLKGITEPVPVYEVVYERETPHRWTEEESELYREVAAVAVPSRVEQIATFLALLPFDQDERFHVVELGCGEGALAYAILDYYRNSSVTALDGSESMRAHASQHLATFGARARVEPFDLASQEWLGWLEGAHSVVSSLVLHHLPDGDKVRLFEAMCDRLPERGALLIADVVDPQRPEPRGAFSESYDRVARQQAKKYGNRDEILRKLTEGGWNIFRDGVPADEYPAPLFEQLTWLHHAGFQVVDCFWLKAGFAIFGGYKTRGGSASLLKPFAHALRCAQTAVRMTSGVSSPQLEG